MYRPPSVDAATGEGLARPQIHPDRGGQLATSESVGAVVALWRFPVKSMLGERVDEADVTEQGLVGDRAYALIDRMTGDVVRASNTRLFPNLFGCRASFVEPPRAGREPPPVCITFPDGRSVIGAVEQQRRSAFFDQAGIPSHPSVGSYFDLSPCQC